MAREFNRCVGLNKLFCVVALVAAIGATSCVITPPPVVNYTLPHSGQSSNAVLAVKDFEPVGIIFVNSAKTFDYATGSRTGSRITWEMLLREAEARGAHDVINVRIDRNRVEHFTLSANGNYIHTRTTYNYTATALAIRYTEAVAGGVQVSPQVIPFSAPAEQARQVNVRQARAVNPNPNSWISTEVNWLGGGVRYEHMLGDNFSVGTNAYTRFFLFDGYGNQFYGGVFARWYPFDIPFFIGLGLGYHLYYRGTYDADGFIFSVDLGGRFNVGQGRSFIQPGVKMNIFSGSRRYGWWEGTTEQTTFVRFVPYVGWGWRF